MATAVWLVIDERCVVPALEEAGKKLDGAEGEVVLDFVSVRRVDSGTLRAMEEFAGVAEQKAVKVVLCGVNIDVYKVLKLMKLAPRFTFESWNRDRGTVELEGCDAEASK